MSVRVVWYVFSLSLSETTMVNAHGLLITSKKGATTKLPTDFATVYRKGGWRGARETLTVSTIGWGEAAIRAFLPVRSNNLLR